MTTEQQPSTIPFRQPKVALRWVGFGIAFAGWLVSALLFMSVGRGTASSTLLDAICGPGDDAAATWNCNGVLRSRWGYWPSEGQPRIPVSAYGMAYFAMVGLWYLFVGPVTRGRGAYHLVVTALIVVGVAESVQFVLIMANTLKQWCAACLVVHALNVLLLAVTIAAWPWRAHSQPHRPHPTGRLALATITAGLLALVAHLAVALLIIQGGMTRQLEREYVKIAHDPAYVRWQYERQPTVDLPIRDDEVIRGSADAPHTVVVFTDFQCNRCRQAHAVLGKQLAAHADKLRVIHRHFPQDPTCNPHPAFAAGGHPAACRAARAYEAARIVGGAAAASAMSARLFERQGELELEPYAAWADELGLDVAAFTAAMDASAATERIAADVALGLELDLTGVPVMYLDGRRLHGWSQPETWNHLLGEKPAPTTSPSEP